MRTWSVQQTAVGFEVEAPSWNYWVKAGAAFTVGAGAVYVLSAIAWLILISRAPELQLIRAFTRF